MPARLESGAVRHLEDAILEAAETELDPPQIRVSATQHAAGDKGLGVESVIIEVTVDANDSAVREEMMQQVREQFVGSTGNLVFQTVQRSHERLRSYGSSNDYSVDGVEQSFTGVEVRESGNTMTIGYGWDHQAAAFFERGVSPHTINGQPLISFIWENPPEWVKEAFEQGRSSSGQFKSGWRVFFQSVDHPGIPAARFIRAGLDWLESEVGA